jgi:hypothetical protein
MRFRFCCNAYAYISCLVSFVYLLFARLSKHTMTESYIHVSEWWPLCRNYFEAGTSEDRSYNTSRLRTSMLLQ